jgi:predicted DNA-binding transcriptional regulator AlpA
LDFFPSVELAMPENRVLNPAEAAAFLGVDEGVLKYWRRSKRLGPPFIILGQKTVGYRLADLEAWLAARRVDTMVSA